MVNYYVYENKSIEAVHEGQNPNFIDNWPDMSLHFPLLRISIVGDTIGSW